MMMVALNEESGWIEDAAEFDVDVRSRRPQLRERNSLSKFNTAQRFARKSSRKSGGPSGPRRKLHKRSGL